METVHVHSEAVRVHGHEDTNGVRPREIAVDLNERENEGREEFVVYGYVNENGNEENLGRTLVRLWLTGSVAADGSQ
jgi:hypothetical protein